VARGSATSVLAAGDDIPVSLLTGQFRRSAAGSPAGLRLMDPQPASAAGTSSAGT
jgi:hypothetical protein